MCNCLTKKTCEVFYDKLTYIFVQMPNFNKTIDELKTHLDKWLFILKNLDKFDRIPEKIKEKIFLKVFQIAQYQKMSKEERMAYEDSLKYYRDLKNSLDTAKEEGYTLAEEKYRFELEQERRQKEEALKKHEKSMHHISKAIKNMLATGNTAEEIAGTLDIPLKEVKKLGGL